ncbi:MAG: hypothetical protein IPM47_02995 [Sphingobacteriales bacterium]|nr:MAG: hypothetical protein IPM47_02995 [Sphingobacteriales bacterium]
MKNNVFIIALLLSFWGLKAQEYYIKTFDVDSTESDNGMDILADEEGYVVLCASMGGTGYFKVDTDGEEIWQNNFSFAPYEPGVTGLLQLPDGNYLISGAVIETGMLYQDLFTFVTDEGEIYRHIIHGDTMDNRAPYSVLRNNLVVSYTSITPPGVGLELYNHTLLLTMDTAGVVLRIDTLQNVAGYPRNGSVALLLLPTQEYILGIGAQNEPDKIYGYLRKTDTIGNTLWEQPLNDVATSTAPIHLARLQDGDFVVSWIALLGGLTENRGSCFVRRYNPAGDIIWQYTFEAIGYGRNIQDLYVCANGDIIGCGYTGNFDITGNPTCWIFRLSPEGELIWMREYVYWESLAQFMLLYALTEDPHGDIIATGYANRPDPETGFWKGQAVLLKVNAMGCFGEGGCTDTAIVHSVVTGMDTPPPQAGSGVAISPVKVSWLGYGEMAVFYNLPATPVATIRLYDVHGRHVTTQTLPPYDIFTPIQTPPLPPGIYLYAAEQGGLVVARGKVAVVR